MARSLPEKTLEHWASMYIAHRFTYGSLWWPTSGEDVRVDDLGTVPGKAILLEFKVPEQLPDGAHVVTIDVPQLNKYLSSSVPVYYAFPQPPWLGQLDGSVWLDSERRADLAYRRTGHRWFGNWTLVCSATHLKTQLNPSAHQSATVPVPFLGGWFWTDFWREYRDCGSVAASSLFIVPDDHLDVEEPASSISRRELRGKLSRLRSSSRERTGEERDRARNALRDAPRYFYVPATDSGDSDEYRMIQPGELSENLERIFSSDASILESDSQELSICAIPFDGLDP